MCGKVLQSFSVAPFCRMTASQRFGRSMIHIRSVEQLSCLTCRVTEADRPSSVEKCTPRMLIFNFGNRSKSGELMSGLWGRWGSTSQLYLSNGHPYQGGAKHCSSLRSCGTHWAANRRLCKRSVKMW